MSDEIEWIEDWLKESKAPKNVTRAWNRIFRELDRAMIERARAEGTRQVLTDFKELLENL